MKFLSSLLLWVLLLTSCSGGAGQTPTGTAVSAATSMPTTPTAQTLPTASMRVTTTPDVEQAAGAFLDDWKADDYPAMYNMLTSISRDAVTEENFTQRYRDAAINMTLQSLDYEVLSSSKSPSSAQVAYRVLFHTKVVGDLSPRDMSMGLTLENGSWHVQWDDGLIMPELRGGNTLRIDYDAPSRGNIYDRNGSGLAIYSDIVAVGLNVGQLDDNQEGTLLSVLSNLFGKTPEAIRALYKDKYPGDYVPIGEISKEVAQTYNQTLSGLSGLVMSDYTGRLYPDGGIGPHITGYVSLIQKEELDQYLRDGYQMSDRVGRAGLEAWGEKYLTGVKGATLDVYDPQGRPVTRLAKVDRQPSQNIYMTIDSKLQLQAQQAISGFTGALVVMERDTGRVLAMVSSPEFDPNAFEALNYNYQTELQSISTDQRTPLYNRATMDGYPLGSVFKIITMAATLESGVYKPEDTIDCQYYWYGPDGQAYTDWTLEKGYNPSGILTLPEGLMRSCDPWFYQMGYQLFTNGYPKAVSDMARAFGLGNITNAVGLYEAAGNIPNPTSWPQAVEMAIGQWQVLVNPLQVARFIAAVGNGGTLYEPQVIERIVDPDGNATVSFKSKPQGTLPVKPENLKLIQNAMRAVVNNPRGTAVQVFGGMSIPIYGKTGTAQNDWPGHPHAWFAGYTDARNPDKPDIAIAVICENAGEGSEIAAPIFRRLIEDYFLGQPQTIYPWESKLNVTRTPTSLYTPTTESSSSGGGGSSSGGDQPGGGDINLRTATPAP